MGQKYDSALNKKEKITSIDWSLEKGDHLTFSKYGNSDTRHCWGVNG